MTGKVPEKARSIFPARQLKALAGGLLLGLAAFAPLSAADAAERKIEIIKDADYFGFDLRTETNVSLKDCQTICLNDDGCKAFTYNPKVKWCFLKSDFGAMNSFPGAIAGRVVEANKERDIGPAPQQAFISKDLQQQVRDARQSLSVADDQQGLGASSLAAIGTAERSSGNLDRAATAFKSALALDPANADLWTELTLTGASAAADTDLARQSTSGAPPPIRKAARPARAPAPLRHWRKPSRSTRPIATR